MDLSVIIPCHQLEDYIQPLLDSLKVQKTKYQVEYVFVFDNCTDRTQELVEAANLPNYSCIVCNVRSAGHARNMGIEQAQGKYIWFVDGDDWLLGENVYDLVLDAMYQTNDHRLLLNFKSNSFNMDSDVMVWRHIYLRDFLYGIWFYRLPYNDDVVFMNAVKAKEQMLYPEFQLKMLNQPIYYYNYMRPGSIIYNVFNGLTKWEGDIGHE